MRRKYEAAFSRRSYLSWRLLAEDEHRDENGGEDEEGAREESAWEGGEDSY